MRRPRRGVRTAMQTQIDGHLAGGRIGDQHRHGERIDPCGSSFGQLIVLFMHGVESADAGAQHHGNPGWDRMPPMAAEAMAQASRAASKPSWAQRSERRRSRGSRDFVAASGTRPAMRTFRSSLQGSRQGAGCRTLSQHALPG